MIFKSSALYIFYHNLLKFVIFLQIICVHCTIYL